MTTQTLLLSPAVHKKTNKNNSCLVFCFQTTALGSTWCLVSWCPSLLCWSEMINQSATVFVVVSSFGAHDTPWWLHHHHNIIFHVQLQVYNNKFFSSTATTCTCALLVLRTQKAKSSFCCWLVTVLQTLMSSVTQASTPTPTITKILENFLLHVHVFFTTMQFFLHKSGLWP